DRVTEATSRHLRQLGRADPCRGVGAAALELEALGLEPAADGARVAERGAADRAIGLQDAVRAGRLLADETLVQRARVLVLAAGGRGDVAVAHPRALRDRRDDRAHPIEIHWCVLLS